MQKQIINDNQRAILESYAEGDYAPLFVEATTQQEVTRALNDSGDTLFKFLMIELSDNEGCRDYETALSRLATAAADMHTVQLAIATARTVAGRMVTGHIGEEA